MIVYLDTSVILRVLLRQPKALGSWEQWSEAYSSELMKVEARRVIDRLRLDACLDDEGVASAHEDLGRIERAIGFIGLSKRVLQRAAGSMPTVLKTLDSLHLASAIALAENRSPAPVFATHDRQQSVAARAMGLRCLG